jgi:hypothetical protein
VINKQHKLKNPKINPLKTMKVFMDLAAEEDRVAVDVEEGSIAGIERRKIVFKK